MNGYRDLRLPPMFDDLDVGICLHDPETGAVVDVNEPLERLYGYSASDLRTMEVEAYTAPSTRFSQERAVRRVRAAAAGDPQLFEWQIERANGELRWTRVHLNATTIDGFDCVLAEVSDVTEYRARERRLRLLSRIVRHNLRNDMNILIGYADRLKAAVEDDTLEDAVETILDIATEVGTLSDSIEQLEEIAEPDATARTPTNLRTVVRSLAEEVGAEYPAAELTVDAPTDVWVVADRGLRYAIGHGLENAIEHSDRDTPSVDVSVVDEPETGRGIVRIADDGPPIPEIETDVLDDTATPNETYHGSGVGLWVMQWCATSLGGELSFERPSPRGNVVRFSLPKADT